MDKNTDGKLVVRQLYRHDLTHNDHFFRRGTWENSLISANRFNAARFEMATVTFGHATRIIYFENKNKKSIVDEHAPREFKETRKEHETIIVLTNCGIL